MAKPSQVIILAEDSRQEQLVRRYCRRCGLDAHELRVVKCPAGEGSGEQWVRERFAAEVQAYRNRRTRAKTTLIVMIDADNLSVQDRLTQLDRKLDEAQAKHIQPEDQVARLVAKRNIETWLLCLDGIPVDENSDYKRTSNDWTALIRSGSESLYTWTRPNAQPAANCIASLQLGVEELKKINL